MSVKFLHFWRLLFGRVVKLVFNVSRKTLGENNVYQGSVSFCHNAWNLGKTKLACWRENFILLVPLTKNFRISWKDFAGSSDLNASRPKVR